VSSDLAMTSAQGTTVPKSTNTSKFWQQFGGGVGEPNTQAFNANTNASARPSMTSLIYQKLMLALSQSMVYTLSKERWFLQIGASICLDARTLGDNSFEALQAGAAAKGSSTISCDFRWLSSGSLLLFLSRNTGRRLCTISHALPRTSESSVLKAGELIILSPSGTVGQYYGVEGAARNHFMHRSIEATKTVVYNWLVRTGTAMPQNLQWVFVRLGVDDDQDVSKESTRNLMDARLSLWPAHLCLCKDSGFPAELSKDEDLIGTSNGTIDPLDKAQSWFLGKGTRVEALETRRRKDLAEIEEAKQVEGNGAEDRSPLYQHQNSQNVTPRDVSGIYPTPPDGLPSGLHDPSTNIESQSSGVDDEMSATPTAERMSGPLEETGNDELFGEMDIDMFASNGLTEDDFNFFDEPDANGKTDPVYRGDHFGLGETVGATTAVSPPIEFSSPSHEEDHHGDISTHLVAGRQEPFQSPGRS